MPVKPGSGSRKSGKVFGQGQKTAKTIRAGLYARVSTQDQQTLSMQNRALREYTARRNWIIAMQVKEVGSGATQRQRREEVMEAARRRDIDVVVVWRLDRWGRSVTDLLATLQELEHLGVGFVSLTEALDLTTPAGPASASLKSRADSISVALPCAVSLRTHPRRNRPNFSITQRCRKLTKHMN